MLIENKVYLWAVISMLSLVVVFDTTFVYTVSCVIALVGLLYDAYFIYRNKNAPKYISSDSIEIILLQLVALVIMVVSPIHGMLPLLLIVHMFLLDLLDLLDLLK